MGSKATNPNKIRGDRIYQAWLKRRKDWEDHPNAGYNDLVHALANEFKVDKTDSGAVRRASNSIGAFLTKGTGSAETWAVPLEDFLELSADYMETGNLELVGIWSKGLKNQQPAQISGNVTRVNAVNTMYVKLPILIGGGAGVWRLDDAMKPPSTEPTPSERIELRVDDTSLYPDVEPGEVIVFRKTSVALLKRSLLIRNLEDPALHAVRVLDPAAFDGKGGFTDSHGNEGNAPLLKTNWEVLGVAIGKLREDGVQF